MRRNRWQVAQGTQVLYISRATDEAGEQEALKWLSDNTPYSLGVAPTMGYEVVPFEGRDLALAGIGKAA
jgi:hypothetical protein